MNKFSENETVYYYGPAQGLRGEAARVSHWPHKNTYKIEFFNVIDKERNSGQDKVVLSYVQEKELRNANEHLICQMAESIIGAAANKVTAVFSRRADRKAVLAADRWEISDADTQEESINSLVASGKLKLPTFNLDRDE
jgi:hypothetical protein